MPSVLVTEPLKPFSFFGHGVSLSNHAFSELATADFIAACQIFLFEEIDCPLSSGIERWHTKCAILLWLQFADKYY